MLLIVICLFSILIVGCTDSKPTPLVDKDNITLNIGYLSEESFEKTYSNLLQREYPKLKVNIVPMSDLYRSKVTIEEWVKAHPVDLMYIPAHLFESFIDLGQLKELEPYLKKDSYSLDNRVPEVIALTKLYGNGKLYGLPPYFYGRALAFNKELFDKYKVTYPTDGMSWNDINLLAQRFPQGLSIIDRTPLDWILEMGKTLNLPLYNAASRTVSFNNVEWRNVWDSAIQPLRSGKILFDDINENPFLSGERAMTTMHSNDLNKFEQSRLGFQWDLITMPVNPTKPDVSTALNVNGFYAISQTSTNSDDAWEVLQFLLSERAAKWQNNDMNGLSTLSSQLGINEEERTHRAVFHRLRPELSATDALPDPLRELASLTLNELLSNPNIALDTALNELQRKAELLLKSEPANATEE
ncbi:hypothetical protein KCTCHS21_10630 [Cohnella abietis]|uniref:Sugar ABC transporter substrate-binding protein n=1 Tax=Cohnella abietis TaxID=2507935 RepID=A0A3T1D0Q0_9BACL|nr:hypothetical protein KCTCHS21_10630 [Cohnella abietis]